MNKEKALLIKALKTETIKHIFKSNNLIIECNSAAYEVVKRNISKVILDEMCKDNRTKITEEKRTDQNGSNVETVIAVKAEKEEESCKVNLYHTQNKVMVNGKGVHVFQQVVLPLLYEMIRENEMEISQLNEIIAQGMKLRSNQHNDNKGVNKETSKDGIYRDQIKDKISDKKSEEEGEVTNKVTKPSNETPKYEDDDSIAEKLTTKSQYNNMPGVDQRLSIEIKDETKIAAINGEKEKTIINQNNIDKNGNEIIIVGLNEEKEETISNQVNNIDTKKESDSQMEIQEMELKEKEIKEEIDFHTNNRQDLPKDELEEQQKGTKRLRGDEDDEEVVGVQDRTGRKGKKRFENDNKEDVKCVKEGKKEEKENTYIKENEEQQMSIDKQSHQDHTYANMIDEASKEQPKVEVDIGENNDELQLDVANKCKKCKRNVQSKAVMCENCQKLIHYNCLGIKEEQVHKDYPGDYICKDCNTKEDMESEITKDVRKSENQEKENRKISITVTDGKKETNEIEMKEIDWEAKYKELEEEYKQLKKGNNKTKLEWKEKQRELNHKDKLLEERKK